MSHYFDGDENEECGKRSKEWDNLHTFGLEGGRSAAEIRTTMRLMAAASRVAQSTF